MKLFFWKKCSKFCISFIEQNIEVKEQKVDKDATGCNEDVNKDVLVCNEEQMETGATNRQYYKRVCRHMGLSESSPSCAICKLVRLFSCQ